MGVSFQIRNGYVRGGIKGRLKGATINFKKISVGATENLLMAATLADGKTILNNAAREPEIVDLSKFLIKMGANIKGYGTKKIIVNGKKRLKGCSHVIMPDRIECGTFVLCVFGCLGKIKIENLNKEICSHIKEIFSCLKSLKIKILNGGKSLEVEKIDDRSISVKIVTSEYPGFPTDLQAQLTSSLLKTDGTSEINEEIFENRFMHISELIRMGANLELNGSRVFVKGVKELNGAEVMATDLRASSSLIIAGLMAQGKTIINRVYHLDRGYENIEKKLQSCGAKIERIKL